MPKLILGVIHIDRPQELLRSFLIVNELSLRYHTGIEYFVPTREIRETFFFFLFTQTLQYCYLPLLEIPIQDPARVALPADPDPFQYTVASQLMDNQMVFHNP